MENAIKKTSFEELTTSTINLSEIPVTISVSPIERDSDPNSAIFVFSYTVRIVNNSLKDIQLINRHWKVFSNNRQIADVKGDGVVGHQPQFKPTDSFEYTSYTVIKDPVGEMSGSFTFVTDDGMFFDLPIDPFKLSYLERLSLH